MPGHRDEGDRGCGVPVRSGRQPHRRARSQPYPITGLTYLLVYARQRDLATAAGLVSLFAWVLTAGQDLVAPLGYAPLGPAVRPLAYAKLGTITVDRAATAGASAGPDGPVPLTGGPQ